jgi:glycosyltransferase involved in cell wall biosynthesis
MKIKLHFDDIIFQLQGQGGISNYWRELQSRIIECRDFQTIQTSGSKISKLLPVYTNCDIFHSSYYRIPIGKNTKNILTIYDFVYHHGLNKTIYSSLNILQIDLAINRADAIICISENTKQDLLSFHPKFIDYPHVYVVPLGISTQYNEALNLNPPNRLLELVQKTSSKYVLVVGGRKHYKNFKAAVSGFYESSLPKLGFSMICIGSGFSETENKLIDSLGLKQQIMVFENAKADELNYFYQNAFALIYPSLYEGFGLPPLEAMVCRCPVIASNTSSIPEVVGDAGILIDPHKPNEIAVALDNLLSDEIRNDYIIRGIARAKLFDWEKTAQQHIEIYKSLASCI